MSRKMIEKIAFVCVFGGAFAFAPNVHAQEEPVVQSTRNAQTDDAAAQKTRIAERKKKALDTLDELIAQIPALRLPENRLSTTLTAGETLWPYDRKKARLLFTEAINTYDQIGDAQDSPNPDEQNPQAAAALRWQLVQRIGQRDPRLALDFLRASRQTNGDARAPDNEAQLEMGLAAAAAREDPKFAFEIAEQSLSKGYPYELVNLLHALGDKDPEMAAKLSADIIRKLRGETLATNRQAVQFGVYLIQASGAMQRNTPQNTATASSENPIVKKRAALFDESELRELVDIIAAGAVSPGNRDVLPMVQSIMPIFEKYAPSRVAALKQKATQTQNYGDPNQKLWMDFNNLLQDNNSFDAALAFAAKSPAEFQSSFYQQIAFRLMGQGDEARARQIADKVTEPNMRRQLNKQLDNQAANVAVATGKLDEARAKINALTNPFEKAQMLVQLAQSALGRNDQKTARELLSQAREMVNAGGDGLPQLNAMLQLVRVYVAIEPEQSFAMMETFLNRLNELTNAAATLDGYAPYGRSFKEGELILQDGFFSQSVFMQYAEALRSLSVSDYERSVNLTNNLQRQEERLMARLLLTQTVLQDQSDGTQNARSGVYSGRNFSGQVFNGSAVIINR